MSAKIGFIGLGVMGSSMAKNLIKGGEAVTVFDIDSEKTKEFESLDCRIATNFEALCTEAEIVFLSLPDSRVVSKVLLGDHGLLSVLKSESLIIDLSTIEPEVAQKIYSLAKQKEIQYLDAPVSGGAKGAFEGTLAIMVGGDQAAFDRGINSMSKIGSSVQRVGESGSGQIVKLINNMMVAVSFASVAEGLALGRKCGIDADTIYNAVKDGWAGSKVLDESISAISRNDFSPGGNIALHSKDLNYALALAESKDIPAPFTYKVNEIFKAAISEGHGNSSQPILVNMWNKGQLPG